MVQGYTITVSFSVTSIDSDDLIFGLPWLQQFNPIIDWENGRLTLPDRVASTKEAPATKDTDDWDWISSEPVYDDDDDQNDDFFAISDEHDFVLPLDVHTTDSIQEILACDKVALTKHLSTHIAEQEYKKQPVIPIKDKVPRDFHQYLSVFSEDAARRLPPRRMYDHAIDLQDSAKLPTKRIYPLS